MSEFVKNINKQKNTPKSIHVATVNRFVKKYRVDTMKFTQGEIFVKAENVWQRMNNKKW